MKMKKVLLLPLVALLASASVADAHPGWRGGGGWHRGGGFGRGFAGGVVGGLVGGALMNGFRGGYGGYGYGGYGGYGGGYTYAYPPAVIAPPVVVPQTGGVTTCFNNGYTQTCNTTPQMPYVTTYPSVVPGYPVPY